MIKTELTTFWGFLEKSKTEIPIIQRDYAQGREGKENLRKKFLADLKRALDEALVKTLDKRHELKLDFVYGNVVDESLNPLDGQQRLTTLWLMHWYIAYRAGKLEDDVIRNTFKNFTYQTRISSREFCEKLSEFYEPQPEGKSIVEHITNQTWFQSSWKQDPTVIAMLNMLGGNPDKKDSLESVFKDVDFLNYWGILTASNCPITFYFLPLNDFRQPDNLYIKMNARGKQLTGFENFKAELVQHIKELKIDENKKPKETIAHKIDTKWTDVFWINRSNDARIDEIYFAFINRFFLNQFITSKSDKDKFSFNANEVEDHVVFKTLYGYQSNDTHVKYDGYDIYKEKLREESLIDKNSLERLAKTLDSFYNYQLDIIKAFKESQEKNTNDLQVKNSNDTQVHKGIDTQSKAINHALLPQWDLDNSFRFIPTYSKEKDSPQVITTLGQKERIVFHAICRFFEKSEGNGEDIVTPLKQWMRVVWNIVENGGVNTINSMIRTMRLIDELSEHSHSIYEFLANHKPKSDAAEKQVAEEREKAMQILKAIKYNEGPSEEDIENAEKAAFFKGAIRFLFTNEEDVYDWDLFNDRLDRSKKYFIPEGVQEIYAENAILLRSFISFFDDWGMFWNNFQFNNDAKNWKHILTDKLWLSPLSRLLSESIPNLEKWTPSQYKVALNEMQLCVHKDLVTSNLISKILNENYKLNSLDDRYLLYPYNTKAQRRMYMIGTNRNAILAKASENSVQIDNWHIVEGSNYFKGKDIQFTYMKNTFQWYRDGFIYIVAYDKLNNNEPYYPKKNNGEYIRFPEADTTTKNFTDKLDDLINEFKESQKPSNQQ